SSSPIKWDHPAFAEILEQMSKLHSAKNRGYADGGPALGNFDRVAAILHLYHRTTLENWLTTPMGVLTVYILKHLDALMWQQAGGTDDDGTFDERWGDIAIYAVLARCMLRDG